MFMPGFWSHVAHQLGRFSPDDPYERCGLLVTRWWSDQLSFIEVPNASSTPEVNAAITRADFYRVRPGSFSVGVLHTHPGRYKEDALPSPEDHAAAAGQRGLIHAMYHPYTHQVVVYSKNTVRYSFRVRPRFRRRNQ